MRLHLGCGPDILPGWVNVDICPDLGPSVNVWDLEEFPWPFDDGSADEIRGFDIIEHIHGRLVPGFLAECHRILAPGAALRLRTTYWQWKDSYTDPTHMWHPTEQSFDYWIDDGNALFKTQNVQYGGFTFIKDKVEPNPETGQMDVILVKPDA